MKRFSIIEITNGFVLHQEGNVKQFFTGPDAILQLVNELYESLKRESKSSSEDDSWIEHRKLCDYIIPNE